jgi:hypothetical protein
MHGKGGVALGAIVILVGIIMFGTLLTAVDSWAYAAATTTRTIVTTGATSGDVVLGSELYDENLDNVSAITSTLITDNPAPDSYSSVNTTLTVGGLTDDSTRAVTVTYLTAREDSLLSTFQPFLPFLIGLMFLAAGGGLIWSSVRR